MTGKPTRQQAETAVKTLLAFLGEDTQRTGLLDTPKRVVSAWLEMTTGYSSDPAEPLARTFDDYGGYSGVISVRDIHFASACEHHMLPIIGKVHLCYQPTDRVLGLSKIPRLIDIYATRLQTQERMTRQIADAIMQYAGAQGVVVIVEALHMCMSSRGVKKTDALTMTQEVLGVFAESDDARQQAVDSLLNNRSSAAILL